MDYNNSKERIEKAVRELRNTMDGGGTVIALFPITNEEWGMSVAMSDDTPMQILEQLSDALVLGKFEKQEQVSAEDTEYENNKDE